MLTRQLASAGSGKTYTLAKEFIRLYISIPEENGDHDPTAMLRVKRRLRTSAELGDSLRHILAITFTNMATEEMKQRIVDRLADLAAAGETGDVPYMTEFMDEFGASRKQISRTAAEALRVLLTGFSDFQVSTIDSFFQLVMRTFTYEADLPDNYQLEIDNRYVASMGLDTALAELNSGHSSPAFDFWTRLTVSESQSRKGSWNLFSQIKGSIYSDILSMLGTMESESFKSRLDDLTEYFTAVSPKDFIDLYRSLDSLYMDPLRRLALQIKESAKAVLSYIAANGIETEHLSANLYSRLNKMRDLSPGADSELLDPKYLAQLKSAAKKGIEMNAADEAEIRRLTIATGLLYAEYHSLAISSDVRLWSIYSQSMRQLALTWEIRKKIKQIMQDANTQQLSDTNSILHSIIGDSETPFIYERLGSRLNHFLIDEFQDTSLLQWENTLPLLRESESRGQENLIIGDPKQSIYRFRNADSSLITTAVKKEFPDLHDAGADPTKNTNWRSRQNVVRFNNFLFHSLRESGLDYSGSYGDVIQYCAKKDSDGLIRIRLYRNDATDNDTSAEGDGEGEYRDYFREIPAMICDLRDRGFAQKDIAVLVRTHKTGEEVVDCLMDFNASHPDLNIRFVSEDSLKVSRASSIRTVIEALEAINGNRPFTRKAVRHSVLPADAGEAGEDPMTYYSRFLSPESYVSDDLRQMIGGMSILALPALVENILATFVPESELISDAPFIASFQDAVTEFCENKIADIPSFLQWWHSKGQQLTISSPAGTDAVRILTVHASKGLEYDAVIIPDGNYSFAPSWKNKETAWLTPVLAAPGDIPLPGVLPVTIDKMLNETPHEAILTQFCKDVATDSLNKAYVAFTRAKSELHILIGVAPTHWDSTLKRIKGEPLPAKKSSGKKSTDGDSQKIPAIANMLTGMTAALASPWSFISTTTQDRTEDLIDPDILTFSTENVDYLDGRDGNGTVAEITYGSPIRITRKDEKAEEAGNVIERYRVTDTLAALHITQEEDAACDCGDDDDEPESAPSPETPETEGEEIPEEPPVAPHSDIGLMREIMQKTGAVCGRDELERLVKASRVTGRWSDGQLERIEDVLLRLIESEESRIWFDAPGWTVYNFRPILTRRRRTRTPDRVMISPDGSEARVVDFKLGTAPTVTEMTLLRAHAKALRDSGFKGQISSWVVFLDDQIRIISDLEH